MKKLMLHSVLVLFLAVAALFACSNDKEAESKKAAKLIAKKIQAPKDQAVPVKEQSKDRSIGIEEASKHKFEALVKISRLDQGLNLIDEIAGQDPARAAGSPSMMLKGMLQGLDWIDSTRLIVLGVSATNQKLAGFALIPFKKENHSFQASFNAHTGPDYYIVAVPPRPETSVAPAVEAALAGISRTKSKEMLSIELAVGKILEKSDQKIQEFLKKKPHTSQNRKSDGFGLTPQDAKAMMENLLQTGRQLETFAFGIDVQEDVFSGFIEAVPVKQSRLSKIFASPGDTELLGAYRPNMPVSFRSRSFNLSGFYGLMQQIFGKLYEKLGISFSEFMEIGDSFTGEAAGGMAVEKDGTRFEMIVVLKERGKGNDDFLEKVCMPWLIGYGENMTKQIEKQLGKKVGKLFQRSTDTTVSDQKVLGVRFQQFHFPTGGGFVKLPEGGKPGRFETRMTTLGNFLLLASDDKAIQRLIEVAGAFKENPAKGPAMIVDVDIAAYLEALKKLMPAFPGKDQPLPEMGNAVMKIDFLDGKIRSTSSLRIADIKTLSANLKKAAPPEKQPKLKPKTSVSSKPKPKVVKDANYWMNQGDRCAIYGNDKAAIRYYGKALELKPNSSRALFHQGVSYGELGQYEKALSFIDKALAIDTRNGLYYYGRGRVFLLSGDKKKAIEDLKQAAVLGNRTAQNYLQNRLHIEWR